ncbi:MAG: phosphoribosylamine--glycine ligase [Planctomycetota bacterium]
MRILLVGSGGREHALAWKISQSPLCDKLYCAPGNAGIAKHAELVDIAGDGVPVLLKFARREEIDLVVVGPEAPLVAGLVDACAYAGIKAFGPSRAAAQLEGSKAFAKEILHRHAIPTGGYEAFDYAEAAKDYISGLKPPIVVKADGLAAGKGVIICESREEANESVDAMLIGGRFGKSGSTVVIEEFLEGEEASILAFTDGKTIATMPTSQDHKRALDNDRGPNTGGMGAYSPAPVVTGPVYDKIERDILIQTVHAMNVEEKPYRGVLYAGLMIDDADPKVLEFNVRFGDPEAQPILMRLKSDIVPIILATIDGTLDQVEIEWDERPAVCVVMASGGYPGSYKKGLPITGIKEAEAPGGVKVFHAGTARRDGTLVTNGGRVLGVTAVADELTGAIDLAYEAVSRISFKGAHYRKDIAAKALRR